MVIAQCSFLWFGIDSFNQRQSFLEAAVRAEAQIIQVWEVKRTGRTSTIHNALISFETSEGQLVNAYYKTQFEFLSFTDGEKLEVAYLPDTPQTALPTDVLRLWFEPLLAASFAGFFLLLGLFILWPTRKDSNAPTVR